MITTLREKIKFLWKRRLFIIRFNFDLSDGLITLVSNKDRQIGKTTYLVKQCFNYDLGLIVGSAFEKRTLKEKYPELRVYTTEDIRRFPVTKNKEFLVDETVDLRFLNEYYLKKRSKIQIVGGILFTAEDM